MNVSVFNIYLVMLPGNVYDECVHYSICLYVKKKKRKDVGFPPFPKKSKVHIPTRNNALGNPLHGGKAGLNRRCTEFQNAVYSNQPR